MEVRNLPSVTTDTMGERRAGLVGTPRWISTKHRGEAAPLEGNPGGLTVYYVMGVGSPEVTGPAKVSQ
jgi:hypothetical protein